MRRHPQRGWVVLPFLLLVACFSAAMPKITFATPLIDPTGFCPSFCLNEGPDITAQNEFLLKHREIAQAFTISDSGMLETSVFIPTQTSQIVEFSAAHQIPAEHSSALLLVFVFIGLVFVGTGLTLARRQSQAIDLAIRWVLFKIIGK